MSSDKTMDPEERAKLLASVGLTEAEVESGARFETKTDDTDPRWEIITIRQPRGPTRGPDLALSGADAQWRTMMYSLASTSGILTMLAGTMSLSVVRDLGIPIAAQIVASVGEVLSRMNAQRQNGTPAGDA